jgi:hypothetical protein
MKTELFRIVKRLVTRCESSPARIARGLSIPLNEGRGPASRLKTIFQDWESLP